MSILFVLLTFLLVMTITYFRGTKEAMVARPHVGPLAPRLERSLGVAVPQGYCFHPGHTWMAKEGADYARVGLDGFAANLLGAIDRVETSGENRWVRQGQKLPFHPTCKPFSPRHSWRRISRSPSSFRKAGQ